jgi:hypothetical protein
MLRFKQYLILENDAQTGSFDIGQWSKNYKDDVDKMYKELYQKYKHDIDPFTLDTSFNGNVEEYIRTKFMNPEERSMAGRAGSYTYSPLDIDDPKYNDSLVKLRYDPATPRPSDFQIRYAPPEPGPLSNIAPGTDKTPLIDYTKPVSDQDLSTTFPAPGEIKPSIPTQTKTAKGDPNVIMNPPQSDASRWQARRSTGIVDPTQAIKSTGKAVGKAALKMLPVVGTAASLAAMAQRAQAGDYVGAGLEAASEVADYIPGVGTAASMGIQGYLADRDMSDEERKEADQKRARQALRSINVHSPRY